MIRGRPSFLLGLFALASGCATPTLTEKQCRDGAWESVGKIDGLYGRDAKELDEHRAACRAYGIEPVEPRYESGRKEGLARYCTPSAAFQFGKRGQPLRPICPEAMRPSLRSANEEGLGALRDSARAAEVDKELADVNQRMASDSNIVHGISDAMGWSSRSQRKSELTNQQAQLDGARSTLAAKYDGVELPTPSPRYMLGALTSLGIGLGIGHAIQGRYVWTGASHTALQIGGLALAARDCDSGKKSCKDLRVGGLVIFLASKVFEIRDSFLYASQAGHGYPGFDAGIDADGYVARYRVAFSAP